MTEIKRIQVFGERNSGTNYLRKLMRDNYKGITTVGGDRGFGWKHGDLGKPWCYFKEDRTKFCHTIQDYKKDSDDVLFAVIYRNPYEWLQSMHQHAHHAPGMYGLSFNEFLNSKWESYYGVPGHESDPSFEVRSAMMNPKEKFEEYKSVFELRKAKTDIFENFPAKVKNVCYVDYEYVRDNPNEVIKTIADHYGIGFKPGFQNITEDKFGHGSYKKKSYPSFSKAQAELIKDNLDWKQEGKIGYSYNEGALEPSGLKEKLFGPRANSEELVSYEQTVRFS